MASKRLVISDVLKKHLKIIGYLAVSAGLAYVLSLVVNKSELVYLAPIINYVLYAIEKELKKEGYIEALRK